MDKGNPLYMIIFPCAGEAAASYITWQGKLPCQVVTLEYPGHGTRLREASILDVNELSELLFHEICSMIPANARVILYGHSMGGILACLTAQKIERKSQIQLACLILSSCGFRADFDDSTEAVARYLLQSGKISSKVKSSPWLKKYVLPVLWSDLSMIKQFDFDSFTSRCYFSVPVYAFYGVDDLLLDEKSMNYLKKITKGTFRLKSFSGAHFFMNEKRNRENFFRLLSEIVNRIW